MLQLPAIEVIGCVPQEITDGISALTSENYWVFERKNGSDGFYSGEKLLEPVINSSRIIKIIGERCLSQFSLTQESIYPEQSFNRRASTWHADDLDGYEGIGRIVGIAISDHYATEALVGELDLGVVHQLVPDFNNYYEADRGACLEELGIALTKYTDEQISEQFGLHVQNPEDNTIYQITTQNVHRSPANKTNQVKSRTRIELSF